MDQAIKSGSHIPGSTEVLGSITMPPNRQYMMNAAKVCRVSSQKLRLRLVNLIAICNIKCTDFACLEEAFREPQAPSVHNPNLHFSRQST